MPSACSVFHTVVAEGSLHGRAREVRRPGSGATRGIEPSSSSRSLVKARPDTLQP